MKLKVNVVITMLLFLLPLVAYAAGTGNVNWSGIIISWAPFIIIIGLWIYSIYVSQRKYVKRGIQHMEMVEAHMSRTEELLEIIASKNIAR